MPWQIYLMAMIALVGAAACWRDFGTHIKSGLLTGIAIVGGGACVGFAAMVLRGL